MSAGDLTVAFFGWQTIFRVSALSVMGITTKVRPGFSIRAWPVFILRIGVFAHRAENLWAPVLAQRIYRYRRGDRRIFSDGRVENREARPTTGTHVITQFAVSSV